MFWTIIKFELPSFADTQQRHTNDRRRHSHHYLIFVKQEVEKQELDLVILADCVNVLISVTSTSFVCRLFSVCLND